MTTVQSRDNYYETGLEVLSELGYSALKLAEVCRRLGVTTGSFYHYFTNWSDYTNGLITYWQDERTTRLVDTLRERPDPAQRLKRIVEIGLALPHGAERAIRTWSQLDPRVREVQASVDRQRFDAVAQSVTELTGSDETGDRFAHWALYLLVGYEQSTLEPNTDALHEVMLRLVGTIDQPASAVGEEDRAAQ